MTTTAGSAPATMRPLPFDSAKLDRLLDEAGIDVLVATSKHNIQYLLGGYRFFFFDYMDAIGPSRYLPILVYPKGRPDNAAYFGSRLEGGEKELGKFWPPVAEARCWGSTDAMGFAVEHLAKLGGENRRIGIEPSFLPVDAHAVLSAGLPNAEIVDAHYPLERLRARKTPDELAMLRDASERVVASMLSVFAAAAPGQTKNDLVSRLRHEEVGRGLTFEYCLITAGSNLNRSPSGVVLREGDIISLDSGGNYRGYIGDLCRMGIIGEPDSELEDCLGVVDEIQQAARRETKAGALGRDIFASAHAVLEASPHREYLDFLAHGMGLVSHEAPQLTSRGFVPYPGHNEERGLEIDMVVSIETAMRHPTRGFIKLEDTVAVTADGCQGFGDSGRGWNRTGRRVPPDTGDPIERKALQEA